LYFASPLKAFPLELVIGAEGRKTRMTGLPGRRRSSTISLAVWIQYTNVPDGRTDRHRATVKTALRIASRGKQETHLSLTNRATRLEVSQGHPTWYQSTC